MNKNTLLIGAGVIIAAVVLLGRILMPSSEPVVQEKSVAVVVDEQVAEQTENEESVEMNDRYTDYSEEKLAEATENDGRAVLFFAALDWCPSCQAADRDFKNNFDELPADVSILKVDYDNDSETINKYNVVMQDTFVQVDGDGNEIARWNGGGKGIDSLNKNLK
jgi:thiol-disulfide isomerase/thioredoxin